MSIEQQAMCRGAHPWLLTAEGAGGTLAPKWMVPLEGRFAGKRDIWSKRNGFR